MVRNKLCWNARYTATVGLPKQRNSYQSSTTFLCFGSLTALLAFQHNLFRITWLDLAKDLQAMSELPNASVSKRAFMQNLSYEFDLHENEPVSKSHSHMNCFTQRQ